MEALFNKVLIHPVDFDCNMGCRYCYNGICLKTRLEPENTISDELLYKLFSELALVSDTKRLLVIWHGGEPLLAGKEFYRRALKIQYEVLGKNTPVSNALQTNGTLIDDEWIQLFQEYKISPSLSIDGPQQLHDQVRVYGSGESTYNTIIRNYRNLISCQLRCGLIFVVSKCNVEQPDLIWNWILEENIKNCDFLPCIEPENYNRDSKYSVTEDEIRIFSIELFNLWFKHADPSIKIRTFRDIMKGMLGGKTRVCSRTGACTNMMSIDVAGDVVPCGRYHCRPETKYGNLKEDTLVNILSSGKRQHMQELIVKGQDQCKHCKWFSLCNSGCPFLKYAIYGSWEAPYVHCRSRMKLYSYIQNVLS